MTKLTIKTKKVTIPKDTFYWDWFYVNGLIRVLFETKDDRVHYKTIGKTSQDERLCLNEITEKDNQLIVSFFK